VGGAECEEAWVRVIGRHTANRPGITRANGARPVIVPTTNIYGIADYFRQSIAQELRLASKSPVSNCSIIVHAELAPTQLGVDDGTAAWNGSLANNSLFFGSNTTETISTGIRAGSWGGDLAYVVYSTNPWFRMGGEPSNTSGSGVFSFYYMSGSTSDHHSHRTILSGY
jgi:hypothetical protein